MRKESFMRFSVYSVLLAIAVFGVMSYFSYIDLAQQLDKILTSLMVISLLGGLFGVYVSGDNTGHE